jgi:hypothetical protein
MKINYILVGKDFNRYMHLHERMCVCVRTCVCICTESISDCVPRVGQYDVHLQMQPVLTGPHLISDGM